MRDKLAENFKAEKSNDASQQTKETHHRHQILQDAISALIVLGYKQQEVQRLITKLDDGHASSEELIRRVLREMM
jgi:Holliday junction resolvasome RuvABC DNA-binding subunit